MSQFKKKVTHDDTFDIFIFLRNRTFQQNKAHGVDFSEVLYFYLRRLEAQRKRRMNSVWRRRGRRSTIGPSYVPAIKDQPRFCCVPLSWKLFKTFWWLYLLAAVMWAIGLLVSFCSLESKAHKVWSYSMEVVPASVSVFVCVCSHLKTWNSYLHNQENLVATLAPSFLIGSSSFLQVTRTTIKSRVSSNFGPIRSWTVELAALECLEKSPWVKSCGHSND